MHLGRRNCEKAMKMFQKSHTSFQLFVLDSLLVKYNIFNSCVVLYSICLKDFHLGKKLFYLLISVTYLWIKYIWTSKAIHHDAYKI